MAVPNETLGKVFERAICLAYNTPYQGVYRYAMETAEALAPRLQPLLELLPNCTHTAAQGSPYDFTAADGRYLSAKTSKHRIGKVAPQVVGQASSRAFCERTGLPAYVDEPTLKATLQARIRDILPVLESHTFDCPTVYYNQKRNTIRYIVQTAPLPWDTKELTWTKAPEQWNSSTTLKANGVAVLEMQVHHNRPNLAVRWAFDTVLEMFPECFQVRVL
jgi:hypothetical protein